MKLRCVHVCVREIECTYTYALVRKLGCMYSLVSVCVGEMILLTTCTLGCACVCVRESERSGSTYFVDVYVCVCVRERERESEREREMMVVCLCVCVCVCARVCEMMVLTTSLCLTFPFSTRSTSELHKPWSLYGAKPMVSHRVITVFSPSGPPRHTRYLANCNDITITTSNNEYTRNKMLF